MDSSIEPERPPVLAPRPSVQNIMTKLLLATAPIETLIKAIRGSSWGGAWGTKGEENGDGRLGANMPGKYADLALARDQKQSGGGGALQLKVKTVRRSFPSAGLRAEGLAGSVRSAGACL